MEEEVIHLRISVLRYGSASHGGKEWLLGFLSDHQNAPSEVFLQVCCNVYHYSRWSNER